MATLDRFQKWFASQCDGDWEHGTGIRIETLDNPGWSICINIEGTSLEGRKMPLFAIERSEEDWLHASSAGAEFRIRCGSKNLERDWIFSVIWAGI
ncbi:MAG TPA: immunity 53 family protein [Thermoanaerobaculia bacterium]|nr:immunity 53 family protein [Thermoanaerobaculia bacterium]